MQLINVIILLVSSLWGLQREGALYNWNKRAVRLPAMNHAAETPEESIINDEINEIMHENLILDAELSI